MFLKRDKHTNIIPKFELVDKPSKNQNENSDYSSSLPAKLESDRFIKEPNAPPLMLNQLPETIELDTPKNKILNKTKYKNINPGE